MRPTPHPEPILGPDSRLPSEVSDDRVVVRLWRPDDAEVLHRAVIESTEHLRPWMPWIAFEPLSVEQRRNQIDGWRQSWEDGGETAMGIFDGDAVVGATGYVARAHAPGLEIGYWTHVDYLRRGYATRAARLLTTAAFELPGITHVEIHHDKANVRSRRVPERLGFRFVGESPDEITAPGEIGVDCAWQMGAADWTQR
jgi:ribosomal-protein-serine acetyltransferase